jgi:protein-disulfide isomerase
MDIINEAQFKKLQLYLVGSTSLIVAGAYLLQLARFRRESEPLLLSGVNYEVALKGARIVTGDKRTRYCVVEFFDYECPPCRLMAPRVYEAVNKSDGKACLALQNFPLVIHPHAFDLALVSCALDPPQFTEFYNLALKVHGLEAAEFLKRWKLRLDRSKPGWARRASQKLESERAIGRRLSVNGTPTLFLVDQVKGVVYRCKNIAAINRVLSGT